MTDPIDQPGISFENKVLPSTTEIPPAVESIDLVALIFRRQGWMIGFAALGAVIGLIYAFATPRVYAFSSIIEIGRTDAVIESPESTVAKISSGFATQVEMTYRMTAPGNPIAFDFDVRNPRGSNLVIVASKGTEDQQAVHLELHKKILDLLVIDHRRILDVARKAVEVTLGTAERELEGTKERAIELALDRTLLDENKKILASEVQEVKSALTAIHASREAAGKDAGGPAQAWTLLMIDAQAQTNQARLATLEERLNIGLVQEAGKIRQAIVENARSALGQEDKIAELKSKRDNMQETRMVVPPMRSLRPVGIGRLALVVIGFALGACIGIFLILLREAGRHRRAAGQQ